MTGQIEGIFEGQSYLSNSMLKFSCDDSWEEEVFYTIDELSPSRRILRGEEKILGAP